MQRCLLVGTFRGTVYHRALKALIGAGVFFFVLSLVNVALSLRPNRGCLWSIGGAQLLVRSECSARDTLIERQSPWLSTGSPAGETLQLFPPAWRRPPCLWHRAVAGRDDYGIVRKQ